MTIITKIRHISLMFICFMNMNPMIVFRFTFGTKFYIFFVNCFNFHCCFHDSISFLVDTSNIAYLKNRSRGIFPCFWITPLCNHNPDFTVFIINVIISVFGSTDIDNFITFIFFIIGLETDIQSKR